MGVLATAQAVGMALSLATTIASARLMGPQAYGVAALLIAFPSLLWSFVGTKSMAVTTRYIARLHSEGDGPRLGAICKLGFALDLVASLATFALVALTADWVTGQVLGLPGRGRDTIVYAASLPLYSLTGTSGAILSSWGQFRAIAVLQTAEKLLMLGAIVAVLAAGAGVTGYLFARASVQAVTGVLMAVTATRIVHRDHGSVWWTARLATLGVIRRELTGFFGWNYVGVTFSGLLTQIPLMVLGRVRGPVEAGYFRLGTNLVSVGSSLEGALARVTYPILSQRWGTSERAALRSTLRRWTLETGLPLALLMGGGVPLIPLVVPFVLGPQYAGMVLGTQLMMAGVVVSLLFFYVNVFYYAAGRVALWTKAYTGYALLLVVLAWPCAMAWGFLGVAGLVGVGEVIFTLAMVLLIDVRVSFAVTAVARA